jgi:hypothetical protein
MRVIVIIGELKFRGTVESAHSRVLTLRNGMCMAIPPNARVRLAA